MRIGLLDPRWVEQRDKHISDKMNQESVYAPGNKYLTFIIFLIILYYVILFSIYFSYSGAAIEASLKQLAERRTDIFGVGVEETAIGKKIGEEETRKDDKVRNTVN